jgi:hypothetical protein
MDEQHDGDVPVPTSRRFDTRQAADYLTGEGYKTAPATLSKFRCIGGGPEFELWGRTPIYTGSNLLNWARARCSKPRRSNHANDHQPVLPTT